MDIELKGFQLTYFKPREITSGLILTKEQINQEVSSFTLTGQEEAETLPQLPIRFRLSLKNRLQEDATCNLFIN
jgi:hypothetical protein